MCFDHFHTLLLVLQNPSQPTQLPICFLPPPLFPHLLLLLLPLLLLLLLLLLPFCFCFFFFKKKRKSCQVWFGLTMYPWMCGLHWKVVNPPSTTPLKKTLFLLLSISCQKLLKWGWDFMPIYLLHSGILSGLSLHRSCEFKCTSAQLCLGNTVSLYSSTTSGS